MFKCDIWSALVQMQTSENDFHVLLLCHLSSTETHIWLERSDWWFNEWHRRLCCSWPRCHHSCTPGSTTVVMATHGLHWRWRNLTPYQGHPSKPIEKQFSTIDYVIDLVELWKFGWDQMYGDWGTHTRNMGFVLFFLSFFNFLRSLMRVQPKRLDRFWRTICHSTPFGESQTLF